jgi:lathosterol oxidase
VDKNFAVHLPLLDWLFGTDYQPDRWPASYGIAGQRPVPEGFVRQLVYPFRG